MNPLKDSDAELRQIFQEIIPEPKVGQPQSKPEKFGNRVVSDLVKGVWGAVTALPTLLAPKELSLEERRAERIERIRKDFLEIGHLEKEQNSLSARVVPQQSLSDKTKLLEIESQAVFKKIELIDALTSLSDVENPRLIELRKEYVLRERTLQIKHSEYSASVQIFQKTIGKRSPSSGLKMPESPRISFHNLPKDLQISQLAIEISVLETTIKEKKILEMGTPLTEMELLELEIELNAKQDALAKIKNEQGERVKLLEQREELLLQKCGLLHPIAEKPMVQLKIKDISNVLATGKFSDGTVVDRNSRLQLKISKLNLEIEALQAGEDALNKAIEAYERHLQGFAQRRPQNEEFPGQWDALQEAMTTLQERIHQMKQWRIHNIEEQRKLEAAVASHDKIQALLKIPQNPLIQKKGNGIFHWVKRMISPAPVYIESRWKAIETTAGVDVRALLVEVDPAKKKAAENFNASVETHHQMIVRLETEIAALQGHLREIEQAQGTAILLGEINSLKREHAKVVEELQIAERDLRNYNLSLQAAVLQRLLDVIGDRQRAVKSSQKERLDKEQLIAKQQLFIRTAEVGGIGDQGKIAQVKLECAQLKKECDTMHEQEKELTNTAAQLRVAFEKHLNIYEKMPVGTESFLESLERQTTEAAKNFMSLGYWSEKRTSPAQFRQEIQFAMLGYHWKEGLEEFAKRANERREENVGCIAFLAEEVQDFILWANRHPDAAEFLIADIAITVQRVGGEEMLNTLITGLRSRIYTRAILGQLGRGQAPEPRITADDFRWRALADVARCAPAAAALSDSFRTMTDRFKAGDGLSAILLRGAVAGFTGVGTNIFLQQAVKSVSKENLKVSNVVLSAIRGDNATQILTEYRNQAILESVGNTLYALRAPNRVAQDILKKVSREWHLFKNSRGWELFWRTTTEVVVPTACIGAAIACFFLTGPLGGIGLAGIYAIGALGLGAESMRRGSQFISVAWPDNYEKTKRREALDLLNQQNRQEIGQATRKLLDSFYKASVLPKFQVQEEPNLFPRFTGTLEAWEKEYLDALSRAYADQKTRLHGIPTPQELMSTFHTVVNREQVHARIEKMVKETLDEMEIPKDANYEKTKKELVERYEAHLMNRLLEGTEERSGWLFDRLREAVTEEYVRAFATYESGEQAIRTQQQKERIRQAEASRIESIQQALLTPGTGGLPLSALDASHISRDRAFALAGFAT